MYFDGFLRYDRKKKSSSHLSGKKKRYSRLSVGCAVLAITTGKKRYSRLSGGLCCCIVSVFGSGGKSAFFLLWLEIFIMTGKKKSSSRLSGKCAIIITTGKKRYSRLSGGCTIIITTGKKRYSHLYGGLCCCVSFRFW